MKTKKIVLVMLLASFGLGARGQTNVYHPFPDSNAVWNVQFSAGLLCVYGEQYSYVIAGDTIIGSFLYHKLMLGNRPATWQPLH